MKKADVILGVNIFLLILCFTCFASFATGIDAYEKQPNGVSTSQATSEGIRAIGMALSVGISSVAAGYAVAETGKAAIGSVTEKPELFGRTIIYVGLAEGIAIYGLLVSFLIWIGFGG